MNVRFCSSCRSLILADFRFCPYCGVAVNRGPGLAEALDEPFARIEAATEVSAGAAADERQADGRFAELAERLERLEADMNLILEELNQEKQ